MMQSKYAAVLMERLGRALANISIEMLSDEADWNYAGGEIDELIQVAEDMMNVGNKSTEAEAIVVFGNETKEVTIEMTISVRPRPD